MTTNTASDVEEIQERVRSSVDETDEWEVSIPNPHDATMEGEFSVVNLYKNGGNDGEVNVLLNQSGEFDMYEYFEDSSVKVAPSVSDLIECLNEYIEER